jgi:hypothetical protein
MVICAIQNAEIQISLLFGENEILMAMSVERAVFWDDTPCSLVDIG